jgi:CRP-like cAMP-binding protein
MSEENDKVIHSSFWGNMFKTSPGKSELLTVLKDIPPFNELKNSFLKQFIKQLHLRNYIAGEYVFYQGDPGVGLYIIHEGEVQIEYLTPAKKKIIQTNLSKGDFFGELALLDGEKRSSSAIAKTDCKIAVIFKPDLDELIAQSPKDGVAILWGISKIVTLRLRNLNNDYLLLQDKLFDKE